MITKTVIFAALFSILCGMNFSVSAQTLAVENVRFEQGADAKVIINYDLVGKPGSEYFVALSIFIPNPRKKVPISMKSLQGAVGKGVSPGKNLQIIWDLREDYPDGLEGSGFRFIIDAYVPAKRTINKWPWIFAGIAAAGGVAILLNSSSSDSGEAPNLPTPPILPIDR